MSVAPKVQDAHPLSILFKVGGIARPPSAHSPPSPGAADPTLSLGAHPALSADTGILQPFPDNQIVQ